MAPLSRADRGDHPSCKESSISFGHGVLLIVSVRFFDSGYEEQQEALHDSGLTMNFIDLQSVEELHIPTVDLPAPMKIDMIDRQPLRVGFIMQCTVPLLLTIGEHTKYQSS